MIPGYNHPESVNFFQKEVPIEVYSLLSLLCVKYFEIHHEKDTMSVSEHIVNMHQHTYSLSISIPNFYTVTQIIQIITI